MKTPLRGEMLRGADFIIGVVSARGSDPIQTVSYDRHGPRNYQILHYSMGTKHVLYISDSRGNKQHCKLGLFTPKPHVRTLLMQGRDSEHIRFHWTPAWVLSTLKTKCLD